MAELLNGLRGSRKNPSVLKQALLLVRSARPDVLVFIFEGPEDVGVFETWINRMGKPVVHEALPGRGKEQIIALYEKLLSEEPALLKGVHFFVDHDFDAPRPNDDHLFVLNAYSIENLLCCQSTLNSLLSDEFRCAGSPAERQRILDTFERLREDFQKASEEVNKRMFMARRQGVYIVRKPDEASEIAVINLQAVVPDNVPVNELIKLAAAIARSDEEKLSSEYDQLTLPLKERGKYVISMFRTWLRLLASDRKSPTPVLFDNPLPSLAGEPWTATLRRLASASPIPQGLDNFVDRAARMIENEAQTPQEV